MLQASAFAEGERQGGLISQAFTALSAKRGSALGRSLSRLEPQVGQPFPFCQISQGCPLDPMWWDTECRILTWPSVYLVHPNSSGAAFMCICAGAPTLADGLSNVCVVMQRHAMFRWHSRAFHAELHILPHSMSHNWSQSGSQNVDTVLAGRLVGRHTFLGLFG